MPRLNLRRVGATIALSALLATTSAHAANQGSLGATSTGQVSITASVPARIQISNLSDITLSPTDLTATATSNQNVCVWSNTATKGYNITATGNNGGGVGTAFAVGGASLTPVPYTVEWAGTTGQTSGTALTAGTNATGFTSNATSATCASGASPSASLIVRISAANLQAMRATTNYTGTLTLLVAPE